MKFKIVFTKSFEKSLKNEKFTKPALDRQEQ